jgi:chaperonin GroES
MSRVIIIRRNPGPSRRGRQIAVSYCTPCFRRPAYSGSWSDRPAGADQTTAGFPIVPPVLRRDRFKESSVGYRWELKFMDVRPLHDRIIVRRLEEGEQKSGAIIIPDSAKEKPQRGQVIAAGNGKVNDDGERVPLDVKAGDLILFGKYTSQEVKLDGEDYLIMREDEVLAVIDAKK